jgi:hypothetical protein
MLNEKTASWRDTKVAGLIIEGRSSACALKILADTDVANTSKSKVGYATKKDTYRVCIEQRAKSKEQEGVEFAAKNKTQTDRHTYIQDRTGQDSKEHKQKKSKRAKEE